MKTNPSIPIENIYFLFCYAWNRFEEASSIPLGATKSPDLLNLLARVLLSGTRALLRRGLDRNYNLINDEIKTLKGRIDLGRSLSLQARKRRSLACEFDELSHDVLHNRVIKATLRRLAQASTISEELAHELRALTFRFSGVTDIRLSRTDFSHIHLNRNNAYYSFLLKVSELAFDCLLPNPEGAGFIFHDVLRDEQKMARVFEEFVRNFYRLEQNKFSVEPLTMKWDAKPIGLDSAIRLPNMRVDVFLRGTERSIIMDTKYYYEALQSYHDNDSFHSGNLYQMFSYLKNSAALDQKLEFVEGILLYPQVRQAIQSNYELQGHRLKIATIDLTQPWPIITEQLLKLLELSPSVN